MPRVKRGVIHTKRRRSIHKQAKGFRWGRKTRIKLAKDAITHAGAHALRDRRRKKREFRALWQIKINAGARAHGLSYSTFMHGLLEKKIGLDRKILASLAQDEPIIFARLVELAKK